MLSIYQRGTIYLSAAYANWDKRWGKLVKAWSAEIRPERKARLYRLTNVLYDRKVELSRGYRDMLARSKEQERDAQEMRVLLECQNFECSCSPMFFSPEATILAIRYADYDIDKEYLCEECGAVMQIRNH